MSQEDGGGEQDRAQNCQWSIYIALTTTRATQILPCIKELVTQT